MRTDHLRRLTGRHGLYEHAVHTTPRISHGYTTDDNARALVVLARAFSHRVAGEEFDPYLGFVVGGAVEGGWHNRMSHAGVWTDRRGSDDAHGRAIWGLGSVIGSGHQPEETVEALRVGLGFISRHPRALSYAMLGGAAAFGSGPVDSALGQFLSTALSRMPEPRVGSWRWPEERLSYANARIPEAMIHAAWVLGEPKRLQSGLDLLEWLIETERGERGFSFTPVGGRGRDDPRPAFDQQPIEAWAMADACHAALIADGDDLWREGLEAAGRWFLGWNDVGAEVYEARTGAGFDGLERDGVNQNRGAESTLSALGSLARLHELDGFGGS
ncbi:MAG: glycosyltransferase [Acidimicrobiia bacterium]